MTAIPRMHRSYLELPAEPVSVPRARRYARTTLANWQLGHAADEAQVVVSELMTNAVAATACLPLDAGIGLLLAADLHWLAVLVWDASTVLPRQQPTGNDELTGRGLQIIDALSVHWGACADRGGKVVWALLGISSAQRSDSELAT